MLATNDQISIINVYIPPTGNVGTFIDTINTTLQKCSTKTILLAGDFNINLDKPSTHSILLTNTLLNYDLINTTTENTRHTQIWAQPKLMQS